MKTLSRKDSFTIQVLQIIDACLVFGAFYIGSLTRDLIRLALDLGVDGNKLGTTQWMLYIAVPFTPLILERFGFYSQLRTKTTGLAIWQMIQGTMIVVLILGIFYIFTRQDDPRRLILGVGLVYAALFLLVRDQIYRYYLRNQSRQDNSKERVIIAGTGDEMQELLDELDPEITAGWKVVKHFDLDHQPVEELFALLKDQSVSRVLFATKNSAFDKVAMAVEACELQGVEAWLAASFIRTQIARPVFDAIGQKPMLVLRSTPELSWELLGKEMLDRVGSAAIILVTLPFWIFAYIGIRIKSPGAPVFFSQMRAGRYGQPFKMWKFRTMVANAEEMLETIKQEHGNQMNGPVFKLDHDPRIFPFGALLRKLSIDELPQLLNVLLGDMSLVGPRPLPIYEVEAFCEMSHRRRLSVKPGITCEWQAGGRNTITSFEEWVEMDLKYIDNWSLWLDLRILLKTIPAVLMARGAK